MAMFERNVKFDNGRIEYQEHGQKLVGFIRQYPMFCLGGWKCIQTVSFEMLKYLRRATLLVQMMNPQA